MLKLITGGINVLPTLTIQKKTDNEMYAKDLHQLAKTSVSSEATKAVLN